MRTICILDTVYSYSFFPLTTKPLRVTKDTSTIMNIKLYTDIYINNFDIDSKHAQGIACTSISDHHAVFHITGNASNPSLSEPEPICRRNMGHANMVKFSDALTVLDCREIWSLSDAYIAYPSFQMIISEKYMNVFP